MVLKEKTQELFDLIKGNGGRMSTKAMAEELGVKINSVTGRVNSLVKNELAFRDRVDEGGDKPVVYVELTEAGINYVPSEDKEDADE